MIIADRLAVLVDKVYVGYESYSGAVIVAAAISYTIQLYMEFSGCMDMVIGSAGLFGIRLPENFQPAVFCKDMYRFLETMAHYAWCLVQELYFLSGIHFQDGQKVGIKFYEKNIFKGGFWKIYGENGNCSNGTFPGMDQ